jgi:cytochrome oxidase Cu insertion factor (SCO1/SenC/PrrC family)
MRKYFYIIISILGFIIVTLAVFVASEFYAGKWESERLLKVSLKDTSGKPWRISNLKNKLGIIYFGYTYCPDICPTALGDLINALAGMGHDQHLFQPIFISIDPGRDTQQVIKEYILHFDRNLLGLTGTPTQLKSFTFNIGSTYAIQKKDAGDQDYTVNHTIGYFMISSTGKKIRLPIRNNPQDLRKIILKVKNRMLENIFSELKID